jgi:uncharacterized repeat protein (TIGR01451 family)
MKIMFKRAVYAGLALAGVVALTSSVRAQDGISSNALAQISALNAEKYTRTATQLKMDSQLVYAIKQSGGQPVAQGVGMLALNLQTNADGRILVDINAQVSPELLTFISGVGGTVRSSVSNFNAVRALLPLNQIETVASRSDVKFVQSAVPSGTRTGSVDSEGDITHKAAIARATFGVNGAGVNVGVISDSDDFLAQAQSTGDLPANVTVLPGQSGVPGSGEGTAMMEIVYDLAPGANLFFSTANGGPAQFAQNILNLRAAGCDIIVDDVFYFNESPFQDAIIAQAVNSVTASGALYFSAAGNEGNVTHGTSGTWEGDFVNGGAAGTPVNGKGGSVHNFGTATYDTVTGNGFATILLWSDPLGASTNDYDLYVLDSTGNTVVSSSTTVQNGLQDPFELVAPPTPGQRVVVVKASGDDRFIHIDTLRGRLTINTGGNITGHPVATNAFAVAAVDAGTSFPNPFTGGAVNPTEFFSSDGPRRVFYDAIGNAITPGDFSSTGGYVRAKPNIAAADGVSTTLPSNSGLNPFFGTSAAAPHAAAIAALLKSFNPFLSPVQVSNVLTTSALDIEALGADSDSGAGIVMADAALAAAPPAFNLIMVTNILSGGNGNALIDPNECNSLSVVLQNVGTLGATNVSAIISTTNSDVIIVQKTTAYPNVPPLSTVTNITAFKISTSPNYVCGTTLVLSFAVKCDQGSLTNTIQFSSGTNTHGLVFSNSIPAAIPDANPTGTNSLVFVSNVTNAIGGLTVSLYLPHTYDSDLALQLIGPDGTTVPLSTHEGGSGHNYGLSCSQPTVFDDAASASISTGFAPFVGAYRPESPLSAFIGKSGTNVNGIWQLRAVDSVPGDVGIIECWSLNFESPLCSDGGGQCPGVDLALGMTASPEPVFAGSNLVYSITVTNFGPNTAKNVVMSQVLPAGAGVVALQTSQGNIALSGGVVTASFGTLPVNAIATATVTVTNANIGAVVSSASVGGSDTEIDPSNNSAAVVTHVIPPFADLGISAFGSVNPALLGQTLTYTVFVTNNGPASATGVVVTNVLAGTVNFVSAVPTQGAITVSGSNVVANLGSVTNGGTATITISVIPVVEGSITMTATVSGSQADPIPQNNSVSVDTVVGPSSDLAIGIVSVPVSVVVGSNYTYLITVTNRGPSVATSVVVQDQLPAGVNVVTTTNTLSAGAVTANLGGLNPGATATVLFTARCTNAGVVVNSASVVAAQADPNTTNNSASVSTVVSGPIVTFSPANAILTAESITPTNGTIDIGETVTVELYLKNTGNVANTNLFATLLATNGVTNPSGTQNYAIVGASLVKNRPFTFTAAGTNGGTIIAVLQLQDIDTVHHITNNLGTASFSFVLPNTLTFANTNRIDIPTTAQDQQQPGPASPYPSPITVSGVTGLVSKVSVTVSNLSHTYPHDINLLLVSPNGTKIVLMSDAADGPPVSGATVTFDDTAAAEIPASGTFSSGLWQPSAYDASPAFSSPAPLPPYSHLLGDLAGPAQNGFWSLYANDDSTGDFGAIVNGWSLSLTTVNPVNQVADIAVTTLSVPSSPLVGGYVTNIFQVGNLGPNNSASVNFSSALPPGVTWITAGSSGQTSLSFSSGIISGSLGALVAGSNVTITVVYIPTAPGALSLTSTASIASGEIDFNPGNNTAVANTTAVLPVADLALGGSVSPASSIVGSNLTFTLLVTNKGPQTALNVFVTNALPSGVTLTGTNASQGSVSAPAGFVIANLGNLSSGGTASVTFAVAPLAAGSFTNTALVSEFSIDNIATNNAVTNIASAVNPAPLILPSSAMLTAENFSPVDAAIESGETVTVTLSLTNAGLVDTTNLTATLLATNGVTAPSGPAVYGLIPHGGSAVGRSFTFTAGAPADGVITATLQLQDGTNDLGAATFTFGLPSTTAQANTGAIIIPDHGPASPYPSTITLSGLTGAVSHVSVTLSNLTHAFPDDIDVLLVAPSGQKVMLMSDAGGGFSITNVNLTFDDSAAASLPHASALASGTFKPSAYGSNNILPSPAPVGIRSPAFSVFNGLNPSGTWALYVFDHSVGDAGSIQGGWGLSITTVQPLNPVLNLIVTLGATPNPVLVGSALTYTFTVTNLGPAAASSVVLSGNLPAASTTVSSASTAGTPNVSGHTLTLNVPSLAAGAGFSGTVRVSPSAAGTASASVMVSSAQTDLDPVSNQAQVSTAVSSPAAPRLTIVPAAAARFEITITAEPGQVYAVQSSTNLVNWTTVTSGTATSAGILKYTATNTPAVTQRYFKAVRVP